MNIIIKNAKSNEFSTIKNNNTTTTTTTTKNNNNNRKGKHIFSQSRESSPGPLAP